MKMKEGYIIPIFKFFKQICEYFNLVERIKNCNDSSKSRPIVELYILAKWIIVIVGIVVQLKMKSCPLVIDFIILYFLFYNTYTYIKYHAFPSFKNTDRDSITRRLILVSQGFLFMVLSYVYFYISFHEYYTWNNLYSLLEGSIIQSFSTAFISTNTTSFPPKSFLGNGLIISQIIHSYLYIGILIVQTFSEE